MKNLTKFYWNSIMRFLCGLFSWRMIRNSLHILLYSVLNDLWNEIVSRLKAIFTHNRSSLGWATYLSSLFMRKLEMNLKKWLHSFSGIWLKYEGYVSAISIFYASKLNTRDFISLHNRRLSCNIVRIVQKICNNYHLSLLWLWTFL